MYQSSRASHVESGFSLVEHFEQTRSLLIAYLRVGRVFADYARQLWAGALLLNDSALPVYLLTTQSGPLRALERS